MDFLEILSHFWQGFKDSSLGVITFYNLWKEERRIKKDTEQDKPQSPPALRQKKDASKRRTPSRQQVEDEKFQIYQRVRECSILNGVILLLSYIAFKYLFMPGLNSLLSLIFGEKSLNLVWSWIEPLMFWTFEGLWALPAYLVAFIVNTFWFQDIATAAFKYKRGKPVSFDSISKLLADSIFSIFLQLLFLALVISVNYIPIFNVGYILSRFLSCLLYSLYAFDYKWLSMGWELHIRLPFIEANWPYFLGFGLPLVLLGEITSNVYMRAYIFALAFPFFILSTNEANPPKYPSAIHLPIFTPVIWISNFAFRCLFGVNRGKK